MRERVPHLPKRCNDFISCPNLFLLFFSHDDSPLKKIMPVFTSPKPDKAATPLSLIDGNAWVLVIRICSGASRIYKKEE
jgi:hypothetical protein